MEIGGEDYSILSTRDLTSPTATDPAIGGAISGEGQVKNYTFDTTQFSDGWHVLSWHSHIIDGIDSSAPQFGHQLAGEIKIPICIENNLTTIQCP